MGKTVTMLTRALNCVNKGPLIPGKHIKTVWYEGIGLAEWNPSCVFRNLLYFYAIFLNEWKGHG